MSESIAIIGMGCRLPGGANDPEKFWQLLASGRDAWSKVPSTRWNEEAFYHPDPAMNGMTNHRGGYFLDQDLSSFDATFFGISGEEAKAIDPQQRVQLEVAYEALENAGIRLETIQGSETAVYAAIFSRDYDRMSYKDVNSISKYHMVGTGDSILSNRLSYTFNLQGPSMTIDTACSGSLVALHQACQSLRLKESKMALVCASNLILSPDQLIPMSLARFLNSEGHCYSFDARGDGYGRGEGVATLVLKPLDTALADGDNIRAVIRNTGLNQDGRSSNGITVPSSDAQRKLIRKVYEEAGLDPRETIYLEAHGTGTKVGDLAEFESTVEVFETRNSDFSLLMGSVKANIGHLESASGIASIIKAVLMFEKNLVPSNPNLEIAKHGMDYGANNIKIPQELQSFDAHASFVRRASVNGFGYGGTNGHVILEAAPTYNQRDHQKEIEHFSSAPESEFSWSEQDDLAVWDNETRSTSLESSIIAGNLLHPDHKSDDFQKTTRDDHLLVLTARSEKSLRGAIDSIHDWVQNRDVSNTDLANLSYTLCLKRSMFAWRTSFVFQNLADLVSNLSRKGQSLSKISNNHRTLFVFTGQGAQWAGMGKELLQTSPIYRSSIEKSGQFLSLLGADYSLVEELNRGESESRINASWLAQPAVTALQIALVDFLRDSNIVPSAVVGHSSGEIAAAYASGSLSQEAALRASYHRSSLSDLSRKLMSRCGAMIAVGINDQEAPRYIDQLREGSVTVACINSPSSITISGEEDAIHELKRLLDEDSVFNRVLKVDTAYHSHFMESVADTYLQSMGSLDAKDSKIPFFSSVSTSLKTSGFDAEYWVHNLVSPVRFSEALGIALSSFAISDASLEIVEIGPHQALKGAICQTLAVFAPEVQFNYLPSLSRKESATKSMLGTLGKLFEAGYPVNLKSIYDSRGSKQEYEILADLPAYSWDRSNHYWHESRLSRDYRFRKSAYHDLLGFRAPDVTPTEATWRHFVSLRSHPWLADHMIEKAIIFPAAGYVCMAVEALRQIAKEQNIQNGGNFILKDVSFLKALIIPEDESRVELLMSFKSGSKMEKELLGWKYFNIFSITQEGIWSEHCKGHIALELDRVPVDGELKPETRYLYASDIEMFNGVSADCAQSQTITGHYEDCQAAGNIYGSAFNTLENIKINDTSASAKVTMPSIADVMPFRYISHHLIHPATLDNILQLGLPLYYARCQRSAVVPVYFEEMILTAIEANLPGTILEVACNFDRAGQHSALANFVAIQRGAQGKIEPKVIIRGQEFRGLGDSSPIEADKEELRSENIVSSIEWRPDISLLDSDLIFKVRHSREVMVDGISLDAKYKELNQRTARYIQSALRTLPAQPALHRQLVAWCKNYIASDAVQMMLMEIPTMDEHNQDFDVVDEAVSKVGTVLCEILSGNREPLSVLLKDNLLYRLYSDISTTECNRHLGSFLKHLTFKKPLLKVLEIGAGTGETTISVLRDYSAFIDSYDYTDVSSGFFENAASRFQDWQSILSYKVLDIEKDLRAQGFEESSYDLIIAANVVHATAHIDNSLRQINKLLRQDGHFTLIEMVKMHPPDMMVYGLLPGWWAGINDERCCGPILASEKWIPRLGNNQFACKYSANDFLGEAHKCSLFVCTKMEQAQRSLPTVRVIQNTEEISATDLLQVLKRKGLPGKQHGWPQEHEIDDSIYVVLDTANEPGFLNCPEDFGQATLLLTKARKVLWISSVSISTRPWENRGASMTGLVRTARSENPDLQAAVLTVEGEVTANLQNFYVAVHELIIGSLLHDDHQSKDMDFVYRHGKIYIPRVLPEIQLSGSTFSEIEKTNIDAPFHSERSLRLHVEKPGLLDTLKYIDDANQDSLGPDEVEIMTHACGVNFKDVFVALGQMKIKTEMVGECAGVVIKVGSRVPDSVKVNDRVLVAVATPYASKARTNYLNAARIPDSMPFTTAAAIPIVFGTAYEGLINVARLSQGQSVLISAASGGVGQAAIQIAQSVGANIFALVSSDVKRDLLVDQYHLDPAQIFSSRSRRFKDAIMHLTQQNGVDVILNSTSGETLAEMWNCLAPFGTFVEIGKTDIHKKSALNMNKFDSNTTFAAIDLSLMCRLRPARVNAVLLRLMEMFDAGTLSPPHPLTVLEIGQVEDAFRMIQSRKHVGKIVLSAQPGMRVKSIKAPNLPSLHRNGTYIIAGGLGDLARHISRSMAKSGAGNIVLLSRRSPPIAEQDNLRNEFRSLKTNLYILKVDIAILKTVQDAIKFCIEKLPPIRGIVQGAMVLQDCLLTNMSMATFQATLKPKIDGTRNILNTTPKHDLDFVVLLSSMSSIFGPPGQANYSAANSYLDNLAQTAADSGVPIISLNLGMIGDSSAISGREGVISNLSRAGLASWSTHEFISLFEYLISPVTLSKGYKQLMFGVKSASFSNPESVVTKHAMFRPLSKTHKDHITQRPVQAAQELKDIIVPGMASEDVQVICHGMLKRKVATLLAIKEDDIDDDRPFQDLGMDSLVTIELKNWISRDFDASLVTSEITDAAYITELSSLIASRSTIIRTACATEIQKEGSGKLANKVIESPQASKTRDEPQLPPLPLPQLKDSLDFFSTSVGHLCSKSNIGLLQNEIEDFLAPGNLGQTLQSRLVSRSQNPSCVEWQNAPYVNFVYLRVRAPLCPFQSFSTWFKETDRSQTQSERAAMITLAASSFDQKLRAGLVTPDVLNDMPLDMSTSGWIFGSIREPHVNLDIVRKYKTDSYIVVMRKGHAFKVLLRSEDGHYFGFAELNATFEAIASSKIDSSVAVAVLTADDRDSWAKNRQDLQDSNPGINGAALQTIEQALFVVCLDDEKMDTSSEYANHFLLSGGFNRWSDKLMQFIVSVDGQCGITFEHSMLDGSTIGQLNQAIGKCLIEKPPAISGKEEAAPFEQLKFELDDKILQDVERVCKMQESYSTEFQCEVQSLILSDFGDEFFRKFGCSGKTGLQLTIQLASRLLFGEAQPPSWETVTMRTFQGGRVDIAQTLQPKIKHWCDVAAADYQHARSSKDDDARESAERTVESNKSCFTAAAREHASNISRVARGQGFAGHLYALQEMLMTDPSLMANSFGPKHISDALGSHNEDPPAMFKPGSIFWATRPGKFSTDNSSWFSLDKLENEAGYVVPVKEHIYVHYDAQELSSRVFIKCQQGQLGAILGSLHKAVGVVKQVLADG